MPERPTLRIVLRLGFLVVLVGVVSLVGRAVPDALARIPVFQAREYEFRGLRFLSDSSALETADFAPDASLWDDPTEWERRLEAHPLVDEARVSRRFPHTLVVEVKEREPVGLVPTPTLEPVDRDGRYLPVDPARVPLDYPILRPTTVDQVPESAPPAVRIRELADAAERLRADAEFHREISEIARGAHGEIVVRRGQPEVEFLLPPVVDVAMLRLALQALDEARVRGGGRTPFRVDLRFADKIFLDWGSGGLP